jgi:prepilin-type N-terminal cleavage/methylation domain-containing protein
MKNKKAFTLIELLVVIAIIAIVASVAMVSLGGARDAAGEAKIRAEASQMKRYIEMQELMYGSDGIQAVIDEFINKHDYIDKGKYSVANNSFCLGYTINDSPWCTDKNNNLVQSVCHIGGVNEGKCSCSGIEIGDECGGGIVAGITGDKILIAASTDINPGSIYQWGCYGQSVSPDATSTTDGATNTTNIINFHAGWSEPWTTLGEDSCHEDNNGEVVARLCNNYMSGGYSDWYLPAINELETLYVNRAAIKEFTTNSYRSSTEENSDAAWIVNFGSGGQGYSFKYVPYHVRCVRRY